MKQKNDPSPIEAEFFWTSSGLRGRKDLDLRCSPEHGRGGGEVVHLGKPKWRPLRSHPDGARRSGEAHPPQPLDVWHWLAIDTIEI